MFIIGIDPSLNSTGYGILKKEGNRLIYLTSGVIKFKVGLEGGDFYLKLFNLSNSLSDILKEFKPEIAGIEETFVNANSKSSLKLANARGAILLTLMQHNVNIDEFSPNYIKKVITGNGKAHKEQVSFMVLKLLSSFPKEKTFETEDESDALATAITVATTIK